MRPSRTEHVRSGDRGLHWDDHELTRGRRFWSGPCDRLTSGSSRSVVCRSRELSMRYRRLSRERSVAWSLVHTMKATYELTRDDLAAFIEFHQRTSPAARRQKVGCLVAAFCALMILPTGILLTTDEPIRETAMDIWPLLLGPILFAIFALPFIRWRTRQMSNRLLSEGQNKEFYGECELEAGDDALAESRPSGSTTRNWTSVERVVTTPSHLFVYTSGIEAYVVPRRAFQAASEFKLFVDRISEHSGVAVESHD